MEEQTTGKTNPNIEQPSQEFHKQNKKWFIIAMVVLSVVAVGVVAGYYFFMYSSDTEKLTPIASTVSTPPVEESIIESIEDIKITLGFSPTFFPKVSADGSKIAFIKFKQPNSKANGLWIMNSDGTNVKQLANDEVSATGSGFEWSPIIDTHYNERYVFYTALKEVEGKREQVIKVVNETGDYIKELTTVDESPSFTRWISINEIAFIDQNDDNKFKLVDTSGRRSPKGQSEKGSEIALVYTEYRDNILTKGTIKSVTFSGVVKDLLSDSENGAFPVLSPDKKKVAYITFSQEPEKIMIMNIDGSNKVAIGPGSQPRWSFDSSMIAYNLSEEQHYDIAASDIYIVNADGSGRKKLETIVEMGPALNPSWFPDGKRIIFEYFVKGIGTITTLSVE